MTKRKQTTLNEKQKSPQLRELFVETLVVSCSSGGRIRTYDLRVMSPTSYQTAPPRDQILLSFHQKANSMEKFKYLE